VHNDINKSGLTLV